MFYNVENFFDIYDDSLTDDNDFLPNGLMRWNSERYKRKTNSIYKTIIAAGEWEPPAVIAFCEIENRKVLEDLIYGTYLSKYNYSIIHEESRDRRGIDVCLIFRKDIVDVLSYKYLIPNEISRKDFNTRSVLYAKLLIVLTVSNDSSRAMINLSEMPDDRGLGTYRYMGTWEMIDQVIVSNLLLNCRSGLYTAPTMLKIFKPDFLLKKDPKYPGFIPFSTYRGYKYQGGFSDHLPVLLDFKLR